MKIISSDKIKAVSGGCSIYTNCYTTTFHNKIQNRSTELFPVSVLIIYTGESEEPLLHDRIPHALPM